MLHEDLSQQIQLARLYPGTFYQNFEKKSSNSSSEIKLVDICVCCRSCSNGRGFLHNKESD